MLSGRQSENIYGYTGKKSSSYNFVSSSSIHGSYKKSTDLKPKPVTLKTEKKETTSSIKKIRFVCAFVSDESSNSDDSRKNSDKEPYEENKLWLENGEKGPAVIDVLKEHVPADIMHKVIYCELVGRTEPLEMMLIPHERGLSVRVSSFDVMIRLDFIGDDEEVITLSHREEKDATGSRVMESKFSFANPEYPFRYVYEKNELDDEIFHDFVSTHLSEIKAPIICSVPAKHTQKEISFRQWVGYIKTSTMMNFRVDIWGWYVVGFSEALEEEEDVPQGMKVFPRSFWTYHPKGTRIEHLIQFQ